MPSSSQRAKSAGTDYPGCSLTVETVLESSIQKQSAKDSGNYYKRNYFSPFVFTVVSFLGLDHLIESQNVLSWKGPIGIRVQLLALCGAPQEPPCAWEHCPSASWSLVGPHHRNPLQTLIKVTFSLVQMLASPRTCNPFWQCEPSSSL